MSRRAKYVGPHAEVAVFDSEASIYDGPIAVVKQNALLPAEAPARIRDELLLASNPDWVEFNQPVKTDDKKEG
jgi:hypothetical protein